MNTDGFVENALRAPRVYSCNRWGAYISGQMSRGPLAEDDEK